MESLALRYAETLEQFNSVLPEPLERLHIIGGGSQNLALNQMTASACGIPVITGPIEATAAGNMLVQLLATGDLASWDEGRELIARSFPQHRYEPEHGAAWRDALSRLRAMG